jgi:hypothetical protein
MQTPSRAVSWCRRAKSFGCYAAQEADARLTPLAFTLPSAISFLIGGRMA